MEYSCFICDKVHEGQCNPEDCEEITMSDKITIELDEYQIDDLFRCWEYWNDLSSNPKDYSAMTDHCHNEADSLYYIAFEAKEKLKELKEINNAI